MRTDYVNSSEEVGHGHATYVRKRICLSMVVSVLKNDQNFLGTFCKGIGTIRKR